MSIPLTIHRLRLGRSGQKSFHPQSCLYSNQIEHIQTQTLGAERCALVAVEPEGLPAVYARDQLVAVRFFPSRWATSFQVSSLSSSDLEELFLQELLTLIRMKRATIHSHQEAVRWVHGDADGFPGLVVDDYGPLVVVQSGSVFGDFLLPIMLAALLRATDQPIFERSSGQIRALEKLPERTRWVRQPKAASNISHEPQDQTISTQLAGLELQFNPLRCQKTGLFLDQRDNLALFKTIVTSALTESSTSPSSHTMRSMLDLCSYVGAWSCAGAQAGLTEFTLVDQDKDALAMSRINIANNTSRELLIDTHHGDLFEVLSKFGKDKRHFGAVVADPPAFTKSAKHVPEAKRAYQRLTRLASRLVTQGGLYVACSCSRHIGEEDFYEIVSGSLDHDDWIYLGRGRQSPDHTVLATDKQSLYLKVLFFKRRGRLPAWNPRAQMKNSANKGENPDLNSQEEST
jgi:23S rRNA (cytosine1962-C5)-methyltransferase